jgi:hypothetical protein
VLVVLLLAVLIYAEDGSAVDSPVVDAIRRRCAPCREQPFGLHDEPVVEVDLPESPEHHSRASLNIDVAAKVDRVGEVREIRDRDCRMVAWLALSTATDPA